VIAVENVANAIDLAPLIFKKQAAGSRRCLFYLLN